MAYIPLSRRIVIRQSTTPGDTPTTAELNLGEIGYNTRDGKLFIKQDLTGGSFAIIEIGAGGGGGSEPANQIVYGTGSGIDSSANFTYNPTTGALAFNSYAGTTGQVLVSNGSSSPPTWQNISGNVPIVLKYVDITPQPRAQIFGWAQNMAQGHVGDNVIIYAGGVRMIAPPSTPSFVITNQVLAYDALQNFYVGRLNMTSARYGHVGAPLGNDQLLVCGGTDGTVELTTVEVFDQSNNTWTTKASLSQPVQRHAATTLLDGRVFICGGRRAGVAINEAKIYDPVGNSWTSVASMPFACFNHCAVTLADGNVLVLSGENTTDPINFVTYVGGGYVYNVNTDSWAISPSNVTVVNNRQSSAVRLADGRVMVNTGEIITGKQWGASETSLERLQMQNLGATIFPAIYGAGAAGCLFTPSTGGIDQQTISNAGTGYDDFAYTNIPLTTLTGTGTGATANITVSGGVVTAVVIINPGYGFAVGDTLSADGTYIGLGGSSFEITVNTLNDKAFICGGGGFATPIDTTMVYEHNKADYNIFSAIPWSNVTVMPDPRERHAVARIGASVALVSGGYSGTTFGVTASSYLYDTTADSWTATTDMPVPTLGHSSVSGATATTALVFGGLDDTLSSLNQTLKYDSSVAEVGAISQQTISNAGDGFYANGTYTGVSLTTITGVGSGATANITVSGGVITSVTIVAPGINYVIGDTLSADDNDLGAGGGSGFEITVAAIDRWSFMTNMPWSAFGTAAVKLTSDTVLVTGGTNGGTESCLTNASIYTISTDSWASTTALPIPLVYHNMLTRPTDNKIVAFGGFTYNQYVGWVQNFDTYVYDPALQTWTAHYTPNAATNAPENQPAAAAAAFAFEAAATFNYIFITVGGMQQYGTDTVNILDPALNLRLAMTSASWGGGKNSTIIADGRVFVPTPRVNQYDSVNPPTSPRIYNPVFAPIN